MDRNDARYWFFRPFLDSGKGQVVGLATHSEQIRDGMAVALVAQWLGGPERPGITVEASRPSLIPAANMVLLGSASLFVEPNAHRISGNARVVGIGRSRLGERLQHLHEGCCLRIVGDGAHSELVVENEITKERFVPRRDGGDGVQEDWGILRRVVRGDVETTIVCEGPHRLGTLGAALAATDATILGKFLKRLPELGRDDESRALEILVRVRFHDERRQGVHSADTVSVQPWCMVYDRQWVCDLRGGAGWTDQLPWDVHLAMRFEEGPRIVGPDTLPSGTARLELEADLREADPGVRRIFREAFEGIGARPGAAGSRAADGARRAAKVAQVLDTVVTEGNRFHLFLAEGATRGKGRIELGGGVSSIRILRQRFLVDLVLCRALGTDFVCDEASLARFFPEFQRGRSQKPLAAKFISDVPGKLLDTFGALFGEAKRRKEYVRVAYARTGRSYRLRPDRAELVVKLRLGNDPDAPGRPPDAKGAVQGAAVVIAGK